MIKIAFVIHDLGHGGAEKVLVNLVNNMDRTAFDITVISLFGGGVNEQFLAEDIHYHAVFDKEFRGNSHVMKLFSPKQLHRWFIKEQYDIEVAYLEGVAARVVSGCPHEDTKLVSWIHCTMRSEKELAIGFRRVDEATACYRRMHRMVFVSDMVRMAFLNVCPYEGQTSVVYNTNDSKTIRALSRKVPETVFAPDTLNLVGVGKLVPHKGFDRLLRIVARLRHENYPVQLYILGVGPQQEELEQYVAENGLSSCVTFLGYQTNPYQYIAKCDIFVCASHAEGFSTAATEALIVGTPVVTVDVSGMKEMLGENDEYGVVVPNDEDALYEALKRFFDEPERLEQYKTQAVKRGKAFATDKTVKATEKMFFGL